ncbi:MAG: aromatic ring-opening dioxygenase LigA [Acidimicrobiia bacterium]|nr:aromatic ring-opening dioxygenase LigA [Acidimicrobiia bacterium]
MRRAASLASLLLGVLLIVGGSATWVVVSTTLADQKIVTSDDACLPGRNVTDPFTAYCQARVIEKHTLEATEGLYYAQLDREDPRRQIAQTSSFLQASLFTSILAFGVAAMALAMGILFVLIGLGIRDVAMQKIKGSTAAP